MSFDGSNKATVGSAQNIPYYLCSTPRIEAVKQKAIALAPPEAMRFLDPLNYKGPTAICDASELSNEEWLAVRRQYLTSSEAGKITGECPFPNANNLAVYNEKIGAKPLLFARPTNKQQLMFKYGHIMEEFLHFWCELNFKGSKVIADTNMYASSRFPFLLANLDRMMRLYDGSWVHVEYKTGSEFGEEAYANGAIPPMYKRQLIQCQHNLGVWISILVVALSRDKVIVRRYDRDLDAEYWTITMLQDFWQNNILPQIPPEPNGSASGIISTLRRYSGKVQFGTERILKPDMLQNAIELAEANRKLKAASDEQARLKAARDAKLVPFVGELNTAEKGYVTDGQVAYQIDYKPQKPRRRIDLDRLKTEWPDIYAEFVEEDEEGPRHVKIRQVNVR